VRIETNEQFLQLASEGKCGNTPRIWLSIDAALRDQNPAKSYFIPTFTWNHFRVYHQTRNDLKNWLKMAEETGGLLTHPTREGAVANINEIYLMENPDVVKQESVEVFQCDWVPDDKWLKWAVTNQPWGKTKREGVTHIAEGLKAISILKHHLRESFYDLEEIRELYPTGIVECTLFPWRGGYYNRHLLVWEVRDY